MNKTYQQRVGEGNLKLHNLIKSASSGDIVCQVTKGVMDRLKLERDDVTFMSASYAGSLPKEHRIAMYSVIKK